MDQEAKQLGRLERRNTWMWGLAALVMIALAAAVVSLSLIQPPDLSMRGYAPRETMVALASGLSALVVLFCLYMGLKQGELIRLRRQLFQSRLNEESLRTRMTGLSELFAGVAEAGGEADLGAVLELFAVQVCGALQAEGASIYLLDERMTELRCEAVTGARKELIRDARLRVGEGISGWVAQHNQPLLLNDDETVLRFAPSRDSRRPIAAGLSVPLAAREQVIGVLNVSRLEPGQLFTAEDALVVTVFGAHIAIAIKRIRERQQATAILRQRDEQLRQAQKMEAIGQLAAGVAHDFNNLLTVILGQSSLLQGVLGSNAPEQRRVEEIQEAATRATLLTRQLLTFSRKQILQPEPLDLNAVVADTASLLRRMLGERIELVTCLAEGLGWIRADRSQIEQVIMNLAVNARDAMPTGGRLTIETGALEADEAARTTPLADHAPGRYLTLTLHDTGHGMDEETQARLFEPFFTTKEPGRGTGLGLSTVYGIVTQSGGTIAVESEPERGATFRIYLPRANARPTSDQAPEPQHEPVPGQETILLVEDEESVRCLLQEILESHGYKVLPASLAGEAVVLATCHEGPIDLVVTDVVMPGRSGGELAFRLGELRPDTPILYISGYPDETILENGVLKEGVALLQKPFDEKVFLAKIGEVLTGASSTHRRRTGLKVAA